MILAPIILFVYNRPWHTQHTVEALQKNELASESELFIFADGSKINATEEQKENIRQVREYIKTISGFKEVHIEEAEQNKGLADSVISGVSKVIGKYGKVIVVEDDIVTSKGFLKYMNDALELYKYEEKVMHVAGYMYPIKNNRLPETFFYPATSCWGWATWKRAWDCFNSDAKDLYLKITNNKLIDVLNINTIHNFEKQLADNANGILNTWFIKWNASVIIKGGYSLYPRFSLVQNIGFDGTGEHCGENNEFYWEKLAQSIVVKKIEIKVSNEAVDALKNFNCNKTQISPKNCLIKLVPGFLKKGIKKIIRKLVYASCPEIAYEKKFYGLYGDSEYLTDLGKNTKLYSPYHLSEAMIGDYTYIARNSWISMAKIGKFCSIGPNLVCGWGIHPLNGISTAPMFFSTRKQNGMSLSSVDKVEERKEISIGNDVFIGANVTILDGVTIGDGAVIGAGAVVSKDIPPYAIAVGCPIKIIRYRFDSDKINDLLCIKWWEFDDEKLKEVERCFWDIDKFIQQNK